MNIQTALSPDGSILAVYRGSDTGRAGTGVAAAAAAAKKRIAVQCYDATTVATMTTTRTSSLDGDGDGSGAATVKFTLTTSSSSSSSSLSESSIAENLILKEMKFASSHELCALLCPPPLTRDNNPSSSPTSGSSVLVIWDLNRGTQSHRIELHEKKKIVTPLSLCCTGNYNDSIVSVLTLVKSSSSSSASSLGGKLYILEYSTRNGKWVRKIKCGTVSNNNEETDLKGFSFCMSKMITQKKKKIIIAIRHGHDDKIRLIDGITGEKCGKIKLHSSASDTTTPTVGEGEEQGYHSFNKIYMSNDGQILCVPTLSSPSSSYGGGGGTQNEILIYNIENEKLCGKIILDATKTARDGSDNVTSAQQQQQQQDKDEQQIVVKGISILSDNKNDTTDGTDYTLLVRTNKGGEIYVLHSQDVVDTENDDNDDDNNDNDNDNVDKKTRKQKKKNKKKKREASVLLTKHTSVIVPPTHSYSNMTTMMMLMEPIAMEFTPSLPYKSLMVAVGSMKRGTGAGGGGGFGLTIHHVQYRKDDMNEIISGIIPIGPTTDTKSRSSSTNNNNNDDDAIMNKKRKAINEANAPQFLNTLVVPKTTNVVLGPGELGLESTVVSDHPVVKKKSKKMTVQLDGNDNDDNDNNKKKKDEDEEQGEEEDSTTGNNNNMKIQLTDDTDPTIGERLQALATQFHTHDDSDIEHEYTLRSLGRYHDERGTFGVQSKIATTDSLSSILTQALLSNDDAMLEVALNVGDGRIIESTVLALYRQQQQQQQQQEQEEEEGEGSNDDKVEGKEAKIIKESTTLLSRLLTKLVTRIAKTPSRAEHLSLWIRVILRTILMSNTTPSSFTLDGRKIDVSKEDRDMIRRLGPLKNLVTERVESLPTLLRLEGRLALLGT